MSAYPRQLPLFAEPAYAPPADFIGPVVSAPGPDCAHPGRLCVVDDLDVCPFALTPWMGRKGYHVTRCGRDEDDREHSVEEIAAIFGTTPQNIVNLTANALEKLRHSRRAGRVAKEWDNE